MFKKLLVLAMLFIAPMVYAATEQAQQDLKNDQAYGTFNILKQPEVGKQKQGIDNHFTFFTINIQINGKIKDDTETNAR